MKRLTATMAAGLVALAAAAQPAGRELFNQGWTFEKDGESRVLDLPHDWGVEGPFVQVYPGETGKLAWWGEACYRKHLTVTAEDLEKDIRLEIDGAMSHSTVQVNGQPVGGWPYGYASYAVRLTPALQEGDNEITIHLDNPENASRWYPGGGIYRNVWLVKTPKTAVAHWGTFLTTDVRGTGADIRLDITLQHDGEPFVGVVTTRIIRREGRTGHVLAETRSIEEIRDGKTLTQTFTLPDAVLWDPEHPALYVARTAVETPAGGEAVYETPFGIRTAEWRADGFYLNGKKTFLKGVCLHHDAGALGAVWNESAWVRRLRLLKSMGCNAIRTSHNPPAPELLDLCDRMGFLVIDELTDTWTLAKKPHGYAELFDAWAEKDLTALIHRDRNHPSVIAWSIGNECGEQGYADKWDIPQRLTDICHREDPTRPTTAGNDNPWAASQPYAATMDVYGFNYKPHLYAEFRDSHPGQPFFGSETASCISTRGYYLFPVIDEKDKGWIEGAPFQVSSYDLYAPAWASRPDYEWFYEDQVPECAGEFVWTGFDYLGEPTPYNVDWSILTNFHDSAERERAEAALKAQAGTPPPARSSYFGILDLAGFPKDRYWLYQARWRPERPLAHILPHWTWPGREGEVTPVHVYTSGDEAELFVNGVSQGKKHREGYRICWNGVVYAPGTVEVVAYKESREWARDRVETAGAPRRILLDEDFVSDDLLYVTARVADKRGRTVPDAGNLLSFRVSGPGEIVATDAGDPTSHAAFCDTDKHAFNGLCSVIIRRTGPGAITLKATSKNLKTDKITL